MISALLLIGIAHAGAHVTATATGAAGLAVLTPAGGVMGDAALELDWAPYVT